MRSGHFRLMSLFATKPIEPVDPTQPMKRVLGPIDLTLLGIGAIIGTGIFVLTGQAAAAHAGPAVVLSMIVAGVASGLAAIRLYLRRVWPYGISMN